MSQEEQKPTKGPRRIRIAGPEDEQVDPPQGEQPDVAAPPEESATVEEQREAPEAQGEQEAPGDTLPEGEGAGEPAAVDLDELRNTLKEFELKCAEAEQDRQRIAAELHNYKRRARQEREVAVRLANERLLSDLIPILDTFELAMQVGADSPAAASILEGISMVYNQLRSALQMHGVEPIQAQGLMFDPSLHEAVEREESAEREPGTILAELAKGYTLNGQVVRAAKVRVAAEPQEGDAGQGRGDG